MDQQAYNPHRKVATILAADIVAYTRLMGEGEDSTLQALKLRRACFEHFVKEFGGRIFGTVGDSFMAEFPSVLNGVKCAVNLQEAIRILNEPLPEKQRMRIRIGLNLGDVIQQGPDLFGDGVNIAARLEQLSDPGGICVAGNVYEQVQRKLDLNYHFLGAQPVKNIGIPITAFKILGSESGTISRWQDFLGALKINQGFRYQLMLVVVLALVGINFLGNATQNAVLRSLVQLAIILGAFFYSFFQFKKIQTPKIKQTSSSIIDSDLIKFGLLTVKNKLLHSNENIALDTIESQALTTVAVLRFSDLSPDQDQAYFSDGLTEELINVLSKAKNISVSSRTSSFAFNNDELDAVNFSKKLGVDYFIKGSVRKVSNRVRITAQLIEVSSNSHLWSETYDRVMNDIFEIQDDISAKIAAALQIKLNSTADKDSLTSDPRAYDFYLRGRAFFGYKGIENIRYAIQMFNMAAKIDPSFVRAWTDLAETYAIQAIFYAGGPTSVSKAKEIAGKVLLMAPERAETYVALGMAHLAQHEYKMAAGRFEKAIILDPTLFEAYHNYARTHYHQGNLKEAIRYFEKAAQVDPDDFESYALAAPLYLALEDKAGAMKTYQLAIERIEHYIADYPENQRAFQLGAIALLQLGNKLKAQEWAEQALSLAPEDPATLYNLACFYAQSNEVDKAFNCLSRSITSRSWIENDPELEPLRQDPRYQQILNSIVEA